MSTGIDPTPGQTVGPFFGFALPFDGGGDLVPSTHPDAIHLHGRVLDGRGDPVPDALVEVWQPDNHGQIVHEAGSLHRNGRTFTGWGRVPTNTAGRYSFTTLTPGPCEDGRVPFFALTLFARGLTNRLFTRAYLPSEPDLVEQDRLLSSLSTEERATLIATADGSGFTFDFRIQGENETVFLAYPER